MAVKLSRKQREVVEKERVAEDQWSRYVRARDGGHVSFVEKADLCDSYYRGDQWDPQDIQKLDSEGRPHLTINMILATVNAVIGEQTAKRVEFRYKPSVGGSEDTATALTKIVQVIKDANRYDYTESQVFQDGIICHGRGFFDIRMKFDDNIHGDIVIRSDDPRSILVDPDAKEYDPGTWTEVFETTWMSLDEVEGLYGKAKADEVRSLGINNYRYDLDSVIWDEDGFGDARRKEETAWAPRSDPEERAIRKVRVIERQHVKRTTVWKFVDQYTGDAKMVPPGWDDRKISEFARKHDLAVVRGVEKRIRWTVTADRVVLHDDWSPYATFTKVPYFCYFRRGKTFGLVSNLISPQQQLNKLSSQELHIINTTANSGWKVEEGALSGMTADDLRNQGAETGLVLSIARGRMDGIEKIQPNSIPTGIDRLSTKSAAFIKQISGINEAMLGQPNPEFSGVALEQYRQAGDIQLQVPFDNLDFTRHLLAYKILELVQQFYTEERVFKYVTDGLNFDDPEEQEVVVNMQTASGEIVNDLTRGKYSVNLAMYPSRDTFMDAQFAEVIGLRSIGVQIPDDRVVEYSHLARKDQLADEIRDITGRGELSEQEMQMLQFQQQIQMGLLQAELAKAEAEVMHLEAQAMKLQAEASLSAGGLDSPEMQMRQNDLEVRLAIAREQVALRRDLAQLSTTARLDQSVLSAKGKLVTDTNKERESRTTKLLVERAKPKPKAATTPRKR